MRILVGFIVALAVFVVCFAIVRLIYKDSKPSEFFEKANLPIGLISGFLGIMVAVIGIPWPITPEQPVAAIDEENPYVEWTDYAFGTMVAKALGKDADEIKKLEMWHIRHLSIFGQDRIYLEDITWDASAKTLQGEEYDFSSVGYIEDLSDLQYFPNLESLTIYNNKVKSLEPLAHCPDLTFLTLSRNEIESLQGVEALVKLDKLQISNNNIRDLNPLRSLKQLKTLNVYNNEVTSPSVITSLEQLEYLNVNDNPVTELPILSKHPSLKELYVGGNSLDDLSALEGNTVLETLEIINTGIEDLSFLESMTGLKSLNVRWNRIQALPSLEKLESLRFLNVSYNYIQDLSPLSQLSEELELTCYRNPVKDWSPAAHFSKVSCDAENFRLDVAAAADHRYVIVNVDALWGIDTIWYQWDDESETTFESPILLEIPAGKEEIRLCVKDSRGNYSSVDEEGDFVWKTYSF